MTAISISPSVFLSKRSVRLSSSSSCTSIYGTTPVTGTPPLSSSICIPGSRIVLSPRNLLIISPQTRFFSSSVKSISVPSSCAKTPPLSISPTSSTGASTICASPMFTISFSFRLISAGLPAPSITMISAYSSSFLNAFFISGMRVFLYAKYSLAGMFLSTLPFTITCEPVLFVGFKRTGFMHTIGLMPAASACITCARPISSPSSVI